MRPNVKMIEQRIFLKFLLQNLNLQVVVIFTFDKVMCKAKKNEGLNKIVM